MLNTFGTPQHRAWKTLGSRWFCLLSEPPLWHPRRSCISACKELSSFYSLFSCRFRCWIGYPKKNMNSFLGFLLIMDYNQTKKKVILYSYDWAITLSYKIFGIFVFPFLISSSLWRLSQTKSPSGSPHGYFNHFNRLHNVPFEYRPWIYNFSTERQI